MSNGEMAQIIDEDDGTEDDGTDFSDSGSNYSPSDDEDQLSEEENVTDSSDENMEFGDDFAPDAAVVLGTSVAADGGIAPDAADALGPIVAVGGEITPDAAVALSTCMWSNFSENATFLPKYTMPADREAEVLLDLTPSATEYNVFRKFFTKGLYIRIAECTNQRLTKLNRVKSSKRNLTDEYEIMTFIGVSLIMHYNHVPAIADYWSKNPSLGNESIKKSMSRDRYTHLSSTIYFNDVEKPNGAPKDYYMSELVACVKKTFSEARSESPFQSIDECMTKFKGRSVLNQYMPMKPIKRGVKMWMRCDAKTGYTYDLNIYTGKETNSEVIGTLGERVVLNLTSTIRNNDVAVIFDRFFTSVSLLKHIPFPAFGTYIKNRRETPAFVGRLDRGHSQFQVNADGLSAARWMDSKEVLSMSNCHMPHLVQVQRKQKDGTRKTVDCPLLISDYNRMMGGVDLADQKTAVYDMNRKSRKWWKKVFFKILMLCVVNAWIIYMEHHHSKQPLIQFIVPLAEALIAEGVKHKGLKTRRTGGRPSKRTKKETLNIGDHLPVEGTLRRRCVRCTSIKKEKRTKFVCSGCNNALCPSCFAPFHQ